MLSPFGAGMVMGMVYNGAVGDTKDAIAKVFRYDQVAAEDLNAFYQRLIEGLPKVDPQTKLHLANSIWYNQNYSILPEFLAVNQQYYNAEVQGLDFGDSQSKDLINDWVKNQTNDKIDKIIDKTSEDDLAFLINAIYFKGDWEQKFEKSNTGKLDFYTASGETVQSDFMKINHSYNVISQYGLIAVELPYSNKKFSMVLIKPSDSESAHWTNADLSTYIENMEHDAGRYTMTTMDLSIPKFKFAYSRNLIPDLTNFGMGVAFNSYANFSGIFDLPTQITKFQQKTFVEVDEEGTEAAAVTAIGIGVTSNLPPVLQMKFDKPFVFLIKENKTNLILFMGKVNNPLSTDSTY
ncbi:serpin family protein [Sphingobacterium hungaricum]|uniref:Proteinase inhibitor I4 serpin n=1 Tax=Sphingobacterium hungaricum TaxID=2082723 RepID=A0A928YQK0_9SPHI|nr:serpin family protein [Sphingobacterium hungaricum]MBE8714044.1 proteinase inhibitor I4 serpin [Sphingobacterium hungaricum]